MNLSADGSIRNPAVAWAVTLWALTLAVVAFYSARQFRQNPRTRFTIVAAVLAIATPVVVKIIATLFYVLPSRSFVAVHFWGISPLQWLAPAVSIVVFACVALWPRRHVAAL